MKNYVFVFIMICSFFSFAAKGKVCTKKGHKKPSSANNTKTDDMKKPLSGMNVSQTRTLVVKEEKGPCDGNPMATCLQIKKEGQTAFEIFYQGIEGFTFEEGYRQTIMVNERFVANAMVKQSAPIYTLIKVISKEKITSAVKPEDIKKPYSGMTISMEKTIVVNEKKTACAGNVTCLQIQKEGQNEFEVLNKDIEGFVFEEGYRQTILVNEHHIPNAMVTDTAPNYTLIKVISKEKIKQ